VLAAAGLIALQGGPARLKEDHRRTRLLAEALVDAGFSVNLAAVQTNILYVTLPDAAAQVARWAERGVLASALGPDSVRFVLHHQISDEALEAALGVLTA
jgi:threonine aldolase